MNSLFKKNYKDFINEFLLNGYKVVMFDSFDLSKKKQLILRHDIDFDIKAAYEIAVIEHEINVKSTFFFLLRGDFYSLINNENYELVIKIESLGHKISLHYDIEIYNNPKKELITEIKIFEDFFNTKVDIISIHRPSKHFLKNPNNYFNVPNTYENKFFEQMSYFADSGGRFRFGNPLESRDYKLNNNIQLLTHPIWWTSNLSSVDDILNQLIKKRSSELKLLFGKNVKTFQK
jgi:hypothetical protein